MRQTRLAVDLSEIDLVVGPALSSGVYSLVRLIVYLVVGLAFDLVVSSAVILVVISVAS